MLLFPTTPTLKKQMKKGNVASQVLLVRQAGGSWSEYLAALNHQQAQIRIHTYEEKYKQKQKGDFFLFDEQEGHTQNLVLSKQPSLISLSIFF